MLAGHPVWMGVLVLRVLYRPKTPGVFRGDPLQAAVSFGRWVTSVILILGQRRSIHHVAGPVPEGGFVANSAGLRLEDA